MVRIPMVVFVGGYVRLLSLAGLPVYAAHVQLELMKAWAVSLFGVPLEIFLAKGTTAPLLLLLVALGILAAAYTAFSVLLKDDMSQRSSDITKLRQHQEAAQQLLQSPVARAVPSLSHLIATIYARLQLTTRQAEHAHTALSPKIRFLRTLMKC